MTTDHVVHMSQGHTDSLRVSDTGKERTSKLKAYFAEALERMEEWLKTEEAQRMADDPNFGPHVSTRIGVAADPSDREALNRCPDVLNAVIPEALALLPAYDASLVGIEGPAIAFDERTGGLVLSYRMTISPTRFYDNIRTATANSIEQAAGIDADTPDNTVH